MPLYKTQWSFRNRKAESVWMDGRWWFTLQHMMCFLLFTAIWSYIKMQTQCVYVCYSNYTLGFAVYSKFVFRKTQFMCAKQMFLSNISRLEDGVG